MRGEESHRDQPNTRISGVGKCVRVKTGIHVSACERRLIKHYAFEGDMIVVKLWKHCIELEDTADKFIAR